MKEKEYVMRKLARKSYCSWELKQKCAEIADIDDIIAEYIQKGYINDDEWLQEFIRTKEAQGNSPLVIAAKLRHKGVPSTVLQAKLAGHSPATALNKLIQKKTKGQTPTGPDKQKLIASLMRRGFSWDAISKALS